MANTDINVRQQVETQAETFQPTRQIRARSDVNTYPRSSEGGGFEYPSEGQCYPIPETGT